MLTFLGSEYILTREKGGWKRGATMVIANQPIHYSTKLTQSIFFLVLHVFREDIQRLRFPNSLDAAKELGRLLSKYKDTHFGTVFIAVMTTYILYPLHADMSTL